MSSPLMMATIASLRPRVPAQQAEFVAACPPASVAANASISLSLPGLAQAGDVLVAQLLHQANNTSPPATNGPAGSMKVIEKQFNWYSTTGLAVLFVYLVSLTATDIANGSVTFDITPSDSVNAIGGVFRGRSQAMLDSAGAWSVAGSTAVVTSPETFSCPGFSTLTDQATLIAGAAIAGAAPPNQSLSTPDGYTLCAEASSDYNYLMHFAYESQSAHGAVAGASYDYSQGSSNPFGWCAWQLALKRALPAVTLDATFPTSTHVDDAVSFDVVATLVDGATGTLTITASGLPAGLSIGATSVVDSTHYKATVSGTLTTVQDVTATFSATGGSVATKPLTHEFNVTAASALQLIGTPTSYNVTVSGTYTVTVPNVQEGDQILIAAVHRMNSGSAAALTFTNSQSTTPRTPGGYVDGGVVLQSAVMSVATAGSINCSIGVPGAGALYVTVYQYRGGTLMPDASNEHGATMARAAGGTPFALGNCNISTRGLALLFAYNGTFSAGTDADMQLNNGAMFTLDADATFASTRHIGVWRTMSSSAFSQSNLSIQTVTTADATILYNWAPYTY